MPNIHRHATMLVIQGETFAQARIAGGPPSAVTVGTNARNFWQAFKAETSARYADPEVDIRCLAALHVAAGFLAANYGPARTENWAAIAAAACDAADFWDAHIDD